MVYKNTCLGFSEVRKRVGGVNKEGKKWKARIRHPKLKYEIYLGLYDSREEAALAVNKKKAEFQNVGTCRDDFKEIKLPPGVRRSGFARFGARIWHPKLKYEVSLGCYNTPEEAASVVENKRAELRGERRQTVRLKPACKDDNKILAESKHEAVISHRLTHDLKVPAGWRKLKSGKWKLKSMASICLRTFENATKAVRSLNQCKAEDAAKRKGDELEWEFGYRCQILVPSPLNNISVDDKSNNRVASVPGNLKYKSVPSSLTSSVFEPEISDRAVVGKRSMISEGKDNNKVLEESNHEAVISGRLTLDLKVPAGRRTLKSGKWKLKSIASICARNFENATEAVRSLSKCKAEHAAKRKGDEFECGIGYRCQTSVPSPLSNTSVDDKSNNRVATVPGNLKYKFGPSSPASVFEHEILDRADVGKRCMIGEGKEQKSEFASEFDEEMSSGFINEYGQLLGKYSVLDEQMDFSSPDEDVTDIGCY